MSQSLDQEEISSILSLLGKDVKVLHGLESEGRREGDVDCVVSELDSSWLLLLPGDFMGLPLIILGFVFGFRPFIARTYAVPFIESASNDEFGKLPTLQLLAREIEEQPAHLLTQSISIKGR